MIIMLMLITMMMVTWAESRSCADYCNSEYARIGYSSTGLPYCECLSDWYNTEGSHKQWSHEARNLQDTRFYQETDNLYGFQRQLYMKRPFNTYNTEPNVATASAEKYDSSIFHRYSSKNIDYHSKDRAEGAIQSKINTFFRNILNYVSLEGQGHFVKNTTVNFNESVPSDYLTSQTIKDSKNKAILVKIKDSNTADVTLESKTSKVINSPNIKLQPTQTIDQNSAYAEFDDYPSLDYDSLTINNSSGDTMDNSSSAYVTEFSNKDYSINETVDIKSQRAQQFKHIQNIKLLMDESELYPNPYIDQKYSTQNVNNTANVIYSERFHNIFNGRNIKVEHNRNDREKVDVNIDNEYWNISKTYHEFTKDKAVGAVNGTEQIRKNDLVSKTVLSDSNRDPYSSTYLGKDLKNKTNLLLTTPLLNTDLMEQYNASEQYPEDADLILITETVPGENFKSKIYPAVTGNLYFFFNQQKVPAHFEQDDKGKLKIGIDGVSLCDALNPMEDRTFILTVICHCIQSTNCTQ